MTKENRFKKLWKRISRFVSVLDQTARTLSALVSIVTFLGLGSVVIGYLQNMPTLLIFGGLILVLSIPIFITLYTLVLEAKERPQTNGSPPLDASVYPPPTIANVVVLLKDIVYEYESDRQTMRQRKRFRVRALQDGVTSFPDRYRWTGQGKCIVESCTPGFKIVNERKEEFWDYFDVQFPHPLHKDEEVEFTIEWKLFDENKSAVPFLSTMIDFDTEHLSMQVILPPELAPRRAYFYDFADYIDTLPIEAQEVEWDSMTHSIRREVYRPKRYHKYLIRWYWG
jgi:hypothetical protein